MRVSKPVREAHRAAILHEAARLFRRRGLDGVGVAEVTQAAGLTHGAFYGHFTSKDALAAAAVRETLLESAAKWRSKSSAEAIITAYLTERHRDNPADGCALSALGPELGRGSVDLSRALCDGTEALVSALAQHTGDRDRAIAILGILTGGIALARALRLDPDASRAALDTARRTALSLLS